MLRKIKLYGKLAKFVGHRVLEADVHNAAEAVKFLVANWPALDQHMAKQYYKVDVGSSALALDEIGYPIGSEDISITPVVAGAGNTGRIILGVALIAAAVYLPGSNAIWGASGGLGFGATNAAGQAIFSGYALAGNVGIMLVLSGVAGLLTPVPKPPSSEEDPQNSFSFSGIQQTSRAGTAVPVCYGEILTGSVVISAEIDVSEQAT
tara:strand:+ start:2055 stop:2675 length:621 start_codon:yes stop_codon:yes gene_type:complete